MSASSKLSIPAPERSAEAAAASALQPADYQRLEAELRLQARLVGFQALRRDAAEQALALSLAEEERLRAELEQAHRLNEMMLRELHGSGEPLHAPAASGALDAEQVDPGAELLQLQGALPRPGAFTMHELRRLARQDLGPMEILCFTGRSVAHVHSYAGARLLDILDHCGFSELPRSERKRCIVVAEGADGYRAIFSWNELYNGVVGEKALVLYERNSLPLDAHLGTLCLISANDARLGPRHLRALQRVTVQML